MVSKNEVEELKKAYDAACVEVDAAWALQAEVSRTQDEAAGAGAMMDAMDADRVAHAAYMKYKDAEWEEGGGR